MAAVIYSPSSSPSKQHFKNIHTIQNKERKKKRRNRWIITLKHRKQNKQGQRHMNLKTQTKKQGHFQRLSYFNYCDHIGPQQLHCVVYPGRYGRPHSYHFLNHTHLLQLWLYEQWDSTVHFRKDFRNSTNTVLPPSEIFSASPTKNSSSTCKFLAASRHLFLPCKVGQ